MALAARVSAGRRKGGGRSRWSREASLSSGGGARREGSEGRAWEHGVHGASVLPGATVKGREMTGGSHLSGISLFSFSRNFREL